MLINFDVSIDFMMTIFKPIGLTGRANTEGMPLLRYSSRNGTYSKY